MKMTLNQLVKAWLALAFSSCAYPVLAGHSLPFNELRFTNRAQCAVDSELPTTSAFTIVDGYNAGRVSYAIARNFGTDPDLAAAEGMKEFRLALTGLQSQIIEKLLRGQLPLLPLNLDAKVADTNLKNYRNIALSCGENVFCPQLKEYIQTLWTESQKPGNAGASLKKLDAYSAQNFVPSTLQGRSTCLYLKKFSPLQGPLQSTGIDAVQLTNLAQTLLDTSKFVDACQSQDEALDSRNAAVQFDLQVTDMKVWDKIGFDFWNSVKIYLSWSWRYAPELQKWSPKYSSLFRNIDFEESVLLMPNGCRAITAPKCDNQTLAINAIRELAKKTGTSTEFDDLIPNGPENELTEKGARAVNNDFLATTSYEKASEWVGNFRKNFTETRWIMKNKVFNANQTMTVIARNYKPAELVEEIKPLVLAGTISKELKDEAAYLCLEWRLSADQKLDFLRTDIDRVAQLETMAQVNQGVGLPIEQQIAYFQGLSEALAPLCEQLEQSQFFRETNYTTDWKGLEAWAKELTKSSMAQENPANPVPFLPHVPATGAFLTLGSDQAVLCANPMDCARKIFKASVDLYAASTYAEAFLPVANTPTSADVFNPYAELKACKVYDPWFAQNRVRKVFVADLVNTALVGWNPIPLYLDVNFSTPKVTSFNKLLQDGKIKFDPNVQKSKMQAALLADFGPLLGTPCAIQISPNADKPFNFYAFSGISLNYCKVRAQRDGVAQNPDDVRVTDPKDASFCAGCTMNFTGVASGVAVTTAAQSFNPLKFGVYLFRAIYRFVKGMQDKTNIPRSYTINLDNVLEAYQRFGNKIPEFCVEPLSQGLKCFEDICASKVGNYIEAKFGVTPTKVTYRNDSSRVGDNRKEASVTVPSCKGIITVPFVCQKSTGSRFGIYEDNIASSGDCRKWVKENR